MAKNNIRMRAGIRWTIGNPSRNGWEALRFSISGAWNLFGADADYAVSMNGVPIEQAQALAGDLPCAVQWRDCSGDLPPFLQMHMSPGMADGAGWKFAPLRLFPDQPELSLDNDCILWELPPALRDWLNQPAAGERCLLMEDVAPAFGKFSHLCGSIPLNTGIRGFPPGWDFGRALREVLAANPVILETEQDEQGLGVAALTLTSEPFKVRCDEVTICSPFPPHVTNLGTCGAHFVGLNAKQIPWDLQGRPATDYIAENWAKYRAEIRRKVAMGSGNQSDSRK
jgi:hypothetical protein